MTIIEELSQNNFILKTFIKENMLMTDAELDPFLKKIKIEVEGREGREYLLEERCKDLSDKLSEANRKLREEVRYMVRTKEGKLIVEGK